jgi:serine/threonine protein kinase/tetratricopeptide (TPR) repeat protein
MTTHTLEDIFLIALEKADSAQRSAYLDEACRDQPELRREIERLLSAHSGIGAFLESPPTEVSDLADTLRDSTVEAADLGFLSPADRPDALGRLGQYLILEVIGSGGFGVVLKALDERLNRAVAIKTLGESLAASATARKRFVREAQAAAAVRHENVVHTYAVEESPVPYLVMEYVAGVSLAEKLQQQGPLSLDEILSIGRQVAEGLAEAHRRGLVHRDVKPANILLDEGAGRVKITDFGLARAIDDASLTASGIIAGTPSYMSPEQARAEPVDHRSDLFSLGSVLYAMCTGQTPFAGSTSLGVLKKVIDEAPPHLREINPGIPEWLTAIIERLMAKQPADRFQSAAEVAELLKAHRDHLDDPRAWPLPRPLPRKGSVQAPARSRRRIQHVAVALALILGVLFVTEATSLTQLIPTIIRVVTGSGVLIVQVDDSKVTVTIEGDGGLIISGAGPQEVRLRPGDYQVRASKDGQPVTVDQPLVTIERGGKQVVKVTREAPKTFAAAEEQRIDKTFAEADQQFALGRPLRDSDPWKAEEHLRKAIALVEPFAKNRADRPKTEQKLADYRWWLASSLNLQVVRVVYDNRNMSPEEAARAVAASQEAIELLPDSGFYTTLGLAHYRAKNWQEASKALERAPTGPGYNPCQANFARALACWQLGDKDQARRWFDEAARWMDKNSPNDPVLQRIRAEAKKLLKDVKSVQQNTSAELDRLNTTIKNNPHDIKALFERAVTFGRLNRVDDAIADYTKIIDAAPDKVESAPAYFARAEIRQSRGDWAGTIADYEQWSKLNPNNGWADGRLGWIFLFAPPAHRDEAKALRLLDRVLTLAPNDHGYTTSRAIAYYRLGRLDDATAALERAATLQPGPNSYDQFALALCYAKAGDTEKARACYSKAIQMWELTVRAYSQQSLRPLREEAEQVVKDLK